MVSSKSPLVAAQYLTLGNGGIAVVARLTLSTLIQHTRARGLACIDDGAFEVDGASVRGCGGSRLRFVAQLRREATRCDAIVYDFLGTARAQALLWPRRPFCAVWLHGEEIWDRPREVYLEALRRADLVLVNSRYTLERAEPLLRGLRDVRLCELTTETDEAPASVGPHFDPPTVLLLGRVDPGFPKGHDILVDLWPDVVADVPDARLLFVGGGGGDALRALVARSPAAASIETAGFVAPEDMEAVWRRASIMAMPSRGEGFGLVFIEAMRRGIPIVASTEDAGATINRDGLTGYNISRGDRDRLTQALIALLRDEALSRRLGGEGHALWQSSYRLARFRENFARAVAGAL